VDLQVRLQPPSWSKPGGVAHLEEQFGKLTSRDLMGHDIRWVKVKAHNGNELNERVDRLAKEARPTPFEKVEGEQEALIPL
jgi:ribonuclease HI